MAYPQKVTFTYNYGCLRIGNSAFVSFLKTKITSIYRIVHNKDPVPHLPPYDFGYIHPANEILYDGPMKNFTICNDSGEDKNCSNKFVPFLEPNDHTFYFVPTDASVCWFLNDFYFRQYILFLDLKYHMICSMIQNIKM